MKDHTVITTPKYIGVNMIDRLYKSSFSGKICQAGWKRAATSYPSIPCDT